MRVLMVCPELPHKGAPGSMAPAARQFQSLRALGVEVDVIDMRGIPKLKYLQALPKIRHLARRADVVHAHFGYCGWLAHLATLGMRNRPPLVLSFMGDDLLGTPYNAQGDLEWFSTKVVSANLRLARKADQVIVKSREMAGVLSPTAATVIPNGVDLANFAPTEKQTARQRLGLPNEGHLVLFPGNPANPRKGHALASTAVKVASLRLSESIDLVPLWKIAPDEVALYMNACDLMLMTSLIEGSPNVVKEAMACDLPVFGVPVGDVEEMLSGANACAVCRRDPEELGKRMAEQLSQPVAANGRDLLIQRGLDLESVALRVIGVYQRALGQRAESLPELTNSWRKLPACEPSQTKPKAYAAQSNH